MMALRIAYSSALVALGTFLEWNYYVSRYTSDGIAPWLAFVIALALNVLLGASVLLRGQRFGKILMWCVIAYSIVNTNAGQEFSFSALKAVKVIENTREANTQDELAEIATRLQQIDEEEAQIKEERRKAWIGSQEVMRRQEPLRTERATLTERQRTLRESAQTHVKTEEAVSEAKEETNTYSFYQKLFLVPEKWLRFGFHLVLSIFIALMAPLGLMGLQESVERETKRRTKGLPEWWEKTEREYYERKRTKMPEDMIKAHARSAGFPQEEIDRATEVMKDMEGDEEGMAKRIAKAVRR